MKLNEKKFFDIKENEILELEVKGETIMNCPFCGEYVTNGDLICPHC